MSDTTFDFGEAIKQLKNGMRVQRQGWNGKGMFLFLVKNYTLKSDDGQISYPPWGCEPVIVMFTAQEKYQPGWLASQADILADDWQIFDYPPHKK